MKKQTITILTIALTLGTIFQSNAQNSVSSEENNYTTTQEERNPVPLMASKPTTTTSTGTVSGFCPVITWLNILDKGSDLIVLGWNNTANFSTISISYALLGSNSWRTITIPGNPNPGRFALTGLNSTTSYEIMVSTTCLNGQVSQWTHPITVTTFDVPAPRIGQVRGNTRMTLNPNPASTTTIVSYQVPAGTTSTLEVINLAGREVFKTQIVSTEDKTQYNLDVTALPSGLYFVRLTNRNGISAERLTKL